MDNIKNDAYFIKRILKDLEFLIQNTNGIQLKDLQENEILCDSIMFRLIQISENSSKISDVFKKNYNEIPWNSIKGMRNRIVHQYGDVDFKIVYDTITRDIPRVFYILKEAKF